MTSPTTPPNSATIGPSVGPGVGDGVGTAVVDGKLVAEVTLLVSGVVTTSVPLLVVTMTDVVELSEGVE